MRYTFSRSSTPAGRARVVHAQPAAMSTLEPPRPHRYIRDVTGIDWRVYERPRCASQPHVMTLVFDSASVVRRVCTYPTDWHRLRDEELLQLSSRT